MKHRDKERNLHVEAKAASVIGPECQNLNQSELGHPCSEVQAMTKVDLTERHLTETRNPSPSFRESPMIKIENDETIYLVLQA